MGAFTGDTVKTDMDNVRSGEQFKGHVSNTDAFETFEDGLIVGRFCKYDAGSIDNLDNSSTPKIAGVVKRNLTGKMTTDTYTTTGEAPDDVAEVSNFGYTTVEIVAGDTPTKYDAVYAYNDVAVPADYGKATTTSTNNVLVTGADFWKQISPTVWVVRLKNII